MGKCVAPVTNISEIPRMCISRYASEESSARKVIFSNERKLK